MKIVFYSMAGEGLGHASRTMAMVEHLENIEVHIFTWGEAYDFFSSINYPHLYKIDGIPFGRDKENKIHAGRTAVNLLKFIWNFSKSSKLVKKLAADLKPSLFISDFEPVLPRVARKLNMPCLSIDNQHKFSRCSGIDLPGNLKRYSVMMGLYTELAIPKPIAAIVSTFYHAAVSTTRDDTILTDCFLRKTFEQFRPTYGDYLLVYYKSFMGDKFLDFLAATNQKIKIYGCPKTKQTRSFEYCELSGTTFIEDLAGCKALIAGSGNQVLGEAAYYGKPVFAIAEPNQPEQSINGYYLEKLGYGTACVYDELDAAKLNNFIDTAKPYVADIRNGVYDAIYVINKFLWKTQET